MTAALAVAALLVFLRVAGFVVFLPPLAGRQTPHSVKIGLGIALTVLWGSKFIPAAVPGLGLIEDSNWLLFGWLAVRETLLGVSLGWLLGLILMPVRVAGAYIAQEMGLTLGSIASATDGSEGNPVSQGLEVAAILAIFGLNLHHQFLRLVDATFLFFPLGRPWTMPSQEWMIGSIAQTTNVGLMLAAPVGVVLFAGLIATLFIMRQAPQFNLFSFGMPVRVLLGLAATAWFLPEIVTGIIHTAQQFAAFRGL